MVYDEHHFDDTQYDFIQEKISMKEGGDLNDEGGVNRQHREGGQNLKSSSGKNLFSRSKKMTGSRLSGEL